MVYVEPRQIVVLRESTFEGLALVASHVSAAPDCGSLKQDTRREESSPRSGDEVRGVTRMKAGHYLDNRRPRSHHLRVKVRRVCTTAESAKVHIETCESCALQVAHAVNKEKTNLVGCTSDIRTRLNMV